MKRLTILAMFLGAGTAVADEVDENLIARWTFAGGALKSDVGDFELRESGGGILETGKGAVTLVGRKALSCPEISSTTMPELQKGVTLWARVKFDELPKDGELGVMGLQAGAEPGGWPALIFSLLFRSMSEDSARAGLGFLARAQGTEELGVGSDLFQTVEAGEFVHVALVFDGQANLAALWVNRTGQWVESKRPNAGMLESFGALLIGKLITPGAETALTFDEVRVYSAALEPGKLEAIRFIGD